MKPVIDRQVRKKDIHKVAMEEEMIQKGGGGIKGREMIMMKQAGSNDIYIDRAEKEA